MGLELAHGEAGCGGLLLEKGVAPFRGKRVWTGSQELESCSWSFWLCDLGWVTLPSLGSGFHTAKCRLGLNAWFPNQIPKPPSNQLRGCPCTDSWGSWLLPAEGSSLSLLSGIYDSASCCLNKAVTRKWKLLGGLIDLSPWGSGRTHFLHWPTQLFHFVGYVKIPRYSS